MNRRYDLVIFDWDGTLMDSAAKIIRCFQNAAIEAGVPPPADAAVRDIIGLGLAEALDILLPTADIATRQRVVGNYRHQFLTLDTTRTALFPGVEEGLAALRNAGFQLAIATGKSRRGLDRALRETAIDSLFCATRCADEARSKPHPQMLEDILTMTAVGAERAIMVGDTTYDLEMASSASVASLAVTYGAHERSRLVAHAPLLCADSFGSVCQWLHNA